MTQKQLYVSLTTVLFVALATEVVRAEDFNDLFSDDAFADVTVETDESAPSTLSVSHTVTSKMVANINSDESTAVEKRYAGLTGLSFTYRPKFDYQPNDTYALSGELEFTTDTIFWLRDEDWGDDVTEAYQLDADVIELIAEAHYLSWQFSTGVQRVALGMADVLSVSNRLYAQNLAQPGMTDIDDAWQPAWTTAASGALGSMRVKAGVVHRHQLNAIPVTGSDFDIGLETQLNAAGLAYEAEDLALDNMGWFASLSGVVGPLDWQMNAISQRTHTPVIELAAVPGSAPQVTPASVVYPRENVLALALSYLTGPVLWKTEVGYVAGRQAQVMNGSALGSLKRYQQVASSVGLDYDPVDLGRLVAELQVARIIDFDQNVIEANAPEETVVQWAMTYRQSFLREQLALSAQVIAFDLDTRGGRMQSMQVTYDWNDYWQTGVKLVDFVSGDYSFLQGADDRDRIVASLRYQF